MNDLIRIGIDTSKSVFVLHGVNAAEQPVLRRQLRRRQIGEFFAKLPPVQIGIEACGAAHYWARELMALGHEVRLLPPQYVKPYVQRGKNDAADASGICEGMSRPRMTFVPVKTAEQQAALMLVGVRDQLVARRTQLGNTIRGYAAEFGLVAAKGNDKIEPLLTRIVNDESLPALARELFGTLADDYARLKPQLRKIEARLMAWHRGNELSRRLAEIPSVGPVDECDRSIPRRETIRGTHWQKTPCGCLELASRNPSWQRSSATATTDRTYDRKRSDAHEQTLATRGPSTYGSRPSPGR